MQIGSSYNNQAAILLPKSGNHLPESQSTLPPTSTENSAHSSRSSSVRELAQTIDPSSMSRNEARAMADALMRSGEGDLSSVFFSHSFILVPDGVGGYRPGDTGDAIMDEKFNMFDAIRGNIEFKQSRGESIEYEIAALRFLENFQAMKNLPEINIFA